MLSKEELKRYQRQLILSRFGEEGQEKLKQAKVLVVGAGGLGGPVSYYLAAAGVGHLVVCDSDVVDLSNLNRQILHTSSDIGKPKSDSAWRSLSALNPEINIECHPIRVDASNVEELAQGVSIIVDCLDNIHSRFVLNEFSVRTGTPIMHAGIDAWSAQLTLIAPPETPCIRCLFGAARDTDEPKPVLGAMAGVVGAIQALETLKFLVGAPSLKNQLLHINGFETEFLKFDIQKNDQCEVCGHL